VATASILVPAAQYLRRSTGLQGCSLEQQALAIAAYAAARGFAVVATYCDDSSGLDLKGRPGLRQLLSAALGTAPPFRTILTYDVSRWGRFQDLDESAHYEFLCRKAGLAVEYCAEPFDNDGSPEANLIKQVKRAMAAEYSRALSERIALAKRQLAAKGYCQSSAPFGYRRHVIDPKGRVVAVLERGQIKVANHHRVVLRPGPDAEVATVRRIFRSYAIGGLKPRAVADQLNAEGAPAGLAPYWTAVRLRQLLANEVYRGVYVYGRSRRRLQGPIEPQPPPTWVRAPGALPALVSEVLFEAAQQALRRGRRGHAAPNIGPRRSRRRTDAEMLDDLRTLLANKQRLDSGLIDEAPGLLGACAYHKRFGGLRRAYALIGYDPRTWSRPNPTSASRHAPES